MPDSNMPDLSRLKFGVGQAVPRQEDPILLQGRGRYTDDISLPGELHAGGRGHDVTHDIAKQILIVNDEHRDPGGRHKSMLPTRLGPSQDMRRKTGFSPAEGDDARPRGAVNSAP